MRILNRNVYVGPSQYAKFPVIRLELDLGVALDAPAAAARAADDQAAHRKALQADHQNRRLDQPPERRRQILQFPG